MDNHFSMSQERIEEVVACDGSLTYAEVEAFCCADWSEGDEHQRWLDTAPAAEIADWVIAGRAE